MKKPKTKAPPPVFSEAQIAEMRASLHTVEGGLLVYWRECAMENGGAINPWFDHRMLKVIAAFYGGQKTGPYYDARAQRFGICLTLEEIEAALSKQGAP